MDVVCAACGSDLTVAREFYDNASVLRPLEALEVMPCCTCMSRAASEAAEENQEHQRESAENDGVGR